MKSVINKTHAPLRVPLPKGKVLHLGPGKIGQVSVHDVDHPPLQKLVADGALEIRDAGPARAGGGGDESRGEFTHGFQHDEKHTRGDR